jgi:magnesium transporter
MKKTLQIGKTQWIFVQAPDKETINKLAQEYDFHEMIIDDLMEVNAQSKIESSGKHFFLALSFTKYMPNNGRYLFNELDVIIGEDYIITTIGLESQSFNDVFDELSKDAEKIDGSYKSSPYYILYRIIDAFYDKTMKSLSYSSQRLLDIQNNMTDKVEKKIIDDLINEDLNKILIKHNFLSQQEVVDDLIDHIGEFHDKHLKVYFNDLKVKLSRIISTINTLTEKNDSLMAAYNTFIGIKNNNSVTKLTFVNAIFMPLTLIAGIGGMSERSMMTGSHNWRIAYPLFIL